MSLELDTPLVQFPYSLSFLRLHGPSVQLVCKSLPRVNDYDYTVLQTIDLCKFFSIASFVQVGLRKHHYEQASGGDGIPVELFEILKDDAVKVLHSICQQIWKTLQWPQDWKRSVFIPILKKGNAKECSNYCTIALISRLQINAQNSPSQASTVREP